MPIPDDPGPSVVAKMRDEISLNGIWRFFPAFERFGGDLGWMGKHSGRGASAGWKGVEFDDSSWFEVEVPGSWNTQLEDLWSYEGHGWYRRTLDAPEEWRDRRVLFHSEGANYRTEIHINGSFAGVHDGGHMPFSIPIHDLLVFGAENTIAVECDNIAKSDRVPGGQTAWWNHGGLYRDVSILTTPHSYIDEPWVRTTLDDSLATVLIDVQAVAGDPGKHRRLQALLRGSRGELVGANDEYLPPEGQTEARLEIAVDQPNLWSPSSPYLYELRLILQEGEEILDSISRRVGIRTVEVRGTQLLLNGEPLIIKGVNRHEQYPSGSHSSATHGEELLLRDLELIRSLGANAIRCHYPNHRRLYELCDEAGILNLIEIPLWQWGSRVVDYDSLGALDAAKDQLREMILTYRNHPCVMIWSVSNENFVVPHSSDADDPRARELSRRAAEGNRELLSMARSLDPSRPAVEVSNHWPEDPVLEDAEILAVNVYTGSPSPPVVAQLGQAYERIHMRLENLRSRHPGKPILVTEFGKWTLKGLLTEYPPGEIYQAEKFKVEWEGFLREPNFVGAFIWSFADYDVHRRYEHAQELRLAYGLFDLKRRPKAAVDAVRAAWLDPGRG